MKKRFGVGKSYADILTILIVIIIIAVIALLGFFTVRAVTKKNVETIASDSNEKFLEKAEENKKKITQIKKNGENTTNSTNEVSASGDLSEFFGQTESSLGEGSGSTTNEVKINKQYLGNYEIKGNINIPKTNCNYPILEKVTVDSLKKSIAILEIVSNPELNKTVKDLNVPGTNAFILGHNYRNGQFFSDNDKLAIGDKIKITDQTGTTITYTIYDMFYTTPDDVSFMQRDIDINTREISLQTCNENSSQRLIILAKDN